MQNDDQTQAGGTDSGQTGAANNAEAPQDPLEHTLEVAEQVWNYELFKVDDNKIAVSQIVIAILLLIIGSIIAKFIARRVGKHVLPKFKVERGAAAAIQSILYYLLLFVVVMLSLQFAGVPMTIFTIVGGALALGIGFGSQNVVANFISGLIVLIERPIQVGNLVEVNGLKGQVTKIGARATHVQAYQGVVYILPNSLVLESPVTNWNYPDDKVRSIVDVGVAYGSPTETVRDILLETAKQTERALDTPKPSVVFRSFGDNALVFELHFWSRSRTTAELLGVESDARYIIDRLCRDADITIAFPQRDVHLDSIKPVEVRVLREGE